MVLEKSPPNTKENRFPHYFKDGTVLHCQITRHVVHKLAHLLFQSGVPVSRGEPREFEQDVKISSDYFDKVSNCEQSQHLGKR